MARQVLPIVGAVIGAYFGGPQGAQLGYAIGSLVGNAVDPQIIRGPKLGEAGLQTSAEGVFRPIIYGTASVKGNVIARGNRTVRTQRDQAGKGGGPVTETQRVYWTYAIRICEGPVSAVLRIWRDGKLVYDIRPESPIPEESSDFRQRFSLYLGTEDQLPDPDLEAYQGVGNASAYRGTCYFVVPNDDLTDLGERIPDYRFEVAQVAEVSESVTDWEYVQQLGPNMSDVAYGENRFVAVGLGELGQGEIWVGNEFGQGFTKLIGQVPTSWQLSSVCYDGAVFFARRAFSGGLISVNGNFWSVVGSASSKAYVVSLFTGNKVLCLGFDGEVEYTTDYTSWTIANIGVIETVRHAISPASGMVVALTQNGSIRRSSDDGATWSAGTVNGTDPYPSSPFTGVAHTAEIIRAYKKIGTSTVAIYTSTDLGVSWDATVETVPSGEYNGESIGIVNGKWVGASVEVLAPDYPALYSSDDGLFPFTQLNVGNGPGTTGESRFTKIIDSEAGIGLALGQESSGAYFVHRNDYSVAETGAGDPVPLYSIVNDLCDRASLEEEQYDASELTDLVDGLVLAGDYTCGDAIKTMAPIYFFDGVECDAGEGYKINFVKRGKPVVATLVIDDLIDVPDKTVREDALERPRVLHMHFENPKIGYAAAKASPRRNTPDVKVVGEISTQVPVVFSDVDEAWQRADVLLKMAWVEVAGQEELSTGDNWLRLVPSDCIGLSLRGQVRRIRITECDYAYGVLKFKMLPDRQSAYTSNLTGIPLPDPTPPLPSIVGQTFGAYLDIPALNDQNDRLLYYTAVTGQSPAWYGARVQRSISGSGFQDVASFNFNTIMGVLLEDVPSASEHYTDTTNSVSVRLYRPDTLDSLTEQEFLSEGGAFALEKDDGSWEVMQYRDSEQDSAGDFVLTTLLRGRLNSGASSHSAGAMFVLLDGVKSVDAVTAWIDQTLTHRYVSHGQSPDGVPTFDDTYVAKSQTEWPVANILLERDGDTISGEIVPRHRFGTEDRPVRSVNWTGYVIELHDSSDQIHTFEQTSDIFTYEATGWDFPVTVTVSQINRYTGAGPAISEEIA
jgi:hypothetical protein